VRVIEFPGNRFGLPVCDTCEQDKKKNIQVISDQTHSISVANVIEFTSNCPEHCSNSFFSVLFQPHLPERGSGKVSNLSFFGEIHTGEILIG
jgi:hypothetical protein